MKRYTPAHRDWKVAAHRAQQALYDAAGECESCGVNLSVGWHFVGCEYDPSVEHEGDVRA